MRNVCKAFGLSPGLYLGAGVVLGMAIGFGVHFGLGAGMVNRIDVVWAIHTPLCSWPSQRGAEFATSARKVETCAIPAGVVAA